jgi:hypothetical protein
VVNNFIKSYKAIVTELDKASNHNVKAARQSKMAHDINALAEIYILKVRLFKTIFHLNFVLTLFFVLKCGFFLQEIIFKWTLYLQR